MFRKLVSNLSFSPALITQVSFYAHRLRQEEITRRMTILFVVLTLIIQSLAIFSPPESANASSEQDLIRGGVTSLDDLLARYDKNTDDIKDIYSALGIERDEIITTKSGTVNSKEDLYSISRYGQYSSEQGETSFVYKRSSGSVGIRYISPLTLADTNKSRQQTGTTYKAWIGQSAKLGKFAILESNASIATHGYPSTITPDSSSASSNLTKTLLVHNLSQNSSADTTKAQPFDKLRYTINIKSTGNHTSQLPLSVSLSDALEYATLVDDGGGTINHETKVLTWNTVSIPSGGSQERTFALQLSASIPATPTGTSNGNSYDCVMATTFGTTTKVNVACPVVKGIESIVGELPPVGMAINIIFSGILIAIVTYFYFRTRQMKKEIRLIRHNINTGTI